MDNESLCRIINHKILKFIVATKGCIWDVQLPSWQAAFYAKDDKNLAKLNLQGKRLHSIYAVHLRHETLLTGH